MNRAVHKCLVLFVFLTGQYSVAETHFPAYEQAIANTEEAISMLPVTGGSFSMGSPANEAGRGTDEGPMHTVSVQDFWMAQYELSWSQYDVFVRNSLADSDKAAGDRLQRLAIDAVTSATTPYVDMSFGMGKKGYPAVNMTQYSAIMYARWLSAQTGEFYRLPTEAEWEYACRAGTRSAWSFGNSDDKIGEYVVFSGNSDGGYALVGSGKPNQWKFYNLHGNVAEWTMDAYESDYTSLQSAAAGWILPKALYPRVARGGSWYHDKYASRCAARLSSSASWKDRDPQLPKSKWWHTNAPFVGIRLVRPRQLPPAEDIAKYWLQAIDDYGR